MMAALLPPTAIAQGWPPRSHLSPQLNLLDAFPIPRDGRTIVLPVNVAGRRYMFALDTGSDVTAFDSWLRPFLGPTIDVAVVQTHNYTYAVDVCLSPPMQIGSIQVPARMPVIVEDLTSLRQVHHLGFYGIIGMDILCHFVLQFDFDKGLLSFTLRPPPLPGRAIGMLGYGPRTRWVLVGLPGLQHLEPFVVDIGAADPVRVRSGLLHALVETGLAHEEGTATRRGVGRVYSVCYARVRQLALSCLHQDGVLVAGSQFNCLTLQFLSKYVITLDFPGGRMFLRPRVFGSSGTVHGRGYRACSCEIIGANQAYYAATSGLTTRSVNCP